MSAAVPPTGDDRVPANPSGLSATVMAYLLAGPLTYGGLGWLLDRWLLHRTLLMPIGVVGGMALSIYVVWLRYGTSRTPDVDGGAVPGATRHDEEIP